MLDCATLGQTKEFLLQQFQSCESLDSADMRLLVEYAESAAACDTTDDKSLSEVDQVIAAAILRKIIIPANQVGGLQIQDSAGNVLLLINGSTIDFRTVRPTTALIPANINDLTNKTYVDSQNVLKQNKLTSGTNIKTINGQSLLGSGNIVITGDGAAVIDNSLSKINQVLESIRTIDLAGFNLFISNGAEAIATFTPNLFVSRKNIDVLGRVSLQQYLEYNNTSTVTNIGRWLTGVQPYYAGTYDIPIVDPTQNHYYIMVGKNLSDPGGEIRTYRFVYSGSPVGPRDVITKDYLDTRLSSLGAGTQTLAQTLVNGNTAGSSIFFSVDKAFDIGTNLKKARFIYSDSIYSATANLPLIYSSAVIVGGTQKQAIYEQRGTIFTDLADLRLKYHDGTSYRTIAFADELAGGGAGTDDQTAVEVPVTDAGAYFIGTNVETVLQELGASVGAGISTVNQSKIDNARDFFIAYHTVDQVINSVPNYMTRTDLTNENKKVINTVENANNVRFLLTNIGEIGQTVIVDNDGTGVVKLVADSTETFIGEGAAGENFEGGEDIAIIPKYGRAIATKKKANLWKIDGSYTTNTEVSSTYNGQNAADTPEFDTFTNVTALNGTVSSSPDFFTSGTKAIKVVATATGVLSAYFVFPTVLIGDVVTMTFDIKAVVANDANHFPRLRTEAGWQNINNLAISTSVSGTNWVMNQAMTETATQNAPTAELVNFAATAGDIFYIDNIRLSIA